MAFSRFGGPPVLLSGALALVLALIGCGSSSTQPPLDGTDDGSSSGSGSSSGGSGSGGSSGGSFTAAHTPLPQVDDNGGGILTTPLIVSVTFPPALYTNATSPDAATMISDLLDFDDTVTQSAWWDTIRAGYCEPLNSTNCVGDGATVNPGTDHVAITTAPAGSYTDASDGNPTTLQPYISGLISAGTLPAPTTNTVYVFYFPQSVGIVFNGSTMCSDIGGYHNSLPVGSLDVAYAIVGICDPEPTAQGTALLSVEQTATFSASHEIIEAVTDPHAGKAPTSSNDAQNLGFYMTDDASQAWPLVLGGGEVADLCVDIVGLGEDRTTEGKYTVQRVWNNISAAASHDPCVPIPSGEVYFNVSPPAADDQLQVAVGSSQSFGSAAFSTAAMAAWTVELVDLGQTSSGTAETILTTAPSKATANNGTSVSCSITLTATPPVQPNEVAGSPGFEPYAIVSFNAAGYYHLWPGIVLAK